MEKHTCEHCKNNELHGVPSAYAMAKIKKPASDAPYGDGAKPQESAKNRAPDQGGVKKADANVWIRYDGAVLISERIVDVLMRDGRAFLEWPAGDVEWPDVGFFRLSQGASNPPKRLDAIESAQHLRWLKLPDATDANVGTIPDKDGWIPHTKGATMPCGPDDEVQVKYHTNILVGNGSAKQFKWGCISAYRPAPWAKKPRPDAEGWIPHVPGDPMPCDRNLAVDIKYPEGNTSDRAWPASCVSWDVMRCEGGSSVFHWRPTKKEPLAETKVEGMMRRIGELTEERDAWREKAEAAENNADFYITMADAQKSVILQLEEQGGKIENYKLRKELAAFKAEAAEIIKGAYSYVPHKVEAFLKKCGGDNA